MAKANPTWTVLPHGPIVKLADNLWWVEGTLPAMSLRRVMTIAKRSDGKLVIHSAIALEERAMREIEAWGTPAYLIVPNGIHRLDAPAFKARYPNLRVFVPRGALAKVQEVVSVDGTYEDFPRDPRVWLENLHGVNDQEGALFVRSDDGLTLILGDVMFNMDKKRDLLGYVFTTALGSAPGPRVSRLAKWLLVRDKKALRADFERFAALTDLERVVVAHEKVAHGKQAAEALRSAASYL